MIPCRSMRLAQTAGRTTSSAGSSAPFGALLLAGGSAPFGALLLAGGEDYGQVEDCRGAREPDHVGLDLAAWRRLDDALEHPGLVVDQEEHRAVPRQWFSGHLPVPSDSLDQYPLRAVRKLSVNFH